MTSIESSKPTTTTTLVVDGGDHLPNNQMILRTKDGTTTIYDVIVEQRTSSFNDYKASLIPTSNLNAIPQSLFHVCSPNGRHVFVQIQNKGIMKVDLLAPSSTMDDLFLQDSIGVTQAAFSPKGTFIVTYQKPNKQSSSSTTTPESNVKVYNTTTLELVFDMYVKSFQRVSWPYIKFSSNEQVAMTQTTNEIRIYPLSSDGKFDRYTHKVRIPDVVSFEVAPSSNTTAAATAKGSETTDSSISSSSSSVMFSTFVPENKGKPAKVSVYRYPDMLQKEVLTKSCFQAEEVSVKWSPRGNAVLLLTHTTVDTTGSSYYGSTQLHLMSLGDSSTTITVPLAKEGPVHAVEWCPLQKKQQPQMFCVISGKMPAMGALYSYNEKGSSNNQCQMTFLLGESHKNTISWSPSGRFLNVSGFGNLAGRMEFWDKNKCKPIPQLQSLLPPEDGGGEVMATFGNTAQAAGCSYGWSPDSRLFHVSTTSPRMNVDNGVRLYRYTGYGPICDFSQEVTPDKLVAAEFIPARSDMVYPDRPQSPLPKGIKVKPMGGGNDPVTTTTTASTNGNHNRVVSSSSVAPGASTSKPASAPSSSGGGAYVPPSRRGMVGGGGSSLAERMRRDKESKTIGATKVVGGVYRPPGSSGAKVMGPGGQSRVIPGMAPVPATQTTKKKKSKSKKATSSTTATATAAAEDGDNAQQPKVKLLTRSSDQEQKQEATAAAAAAATTEQQNIDPEKRLRKLKKTLKQIESLKLKHPDELDDDQQKKIASEKSIIEEMNALHLQISYPPLEK